MLLQDSITVENVENLAKLQFELAQKKTEWMQLVYEKENQMLHPKDKELTEMDRRVMLNASTAVIKKDYEMLVTLERLVRDRIDLFKRLYR